MTRFSLVLWLIAAVVLLRPAFAGTQDAAVVAVHCPAVAFKGLPCDVWPYLGTACSDFDVQNSLGGGWHVWLVVARADTAAGVGGVSFGIDFPVDLTIWAWDLCADQQTRSAQWPATGGSNRITWDADTNCQREVIGADGVHALAGVFYISSYVDAVFAITPNLAEGETSLIVTDCNGEDSELTGTGGSIGLGEAVGYNPCAEDVPVLPSTWGRIKNKYR